MLNYMVARYHGIENPELAWQMCIFLFHLHMCGWAMALHTRFLHLHRLSNQHSWELTYVREHDAALNTKAHPNELAAFVIGWVFNLNVAVIGDNLEVWTNCAFNIDTHTQIYVIKVQGGQWVFIFVRKPFRRSRGTVLRILHSTQRNWKRSRPRCRRDISKSGTIGVKKDLT